MNIVSYEQACSILGIHQYATDSEIKTAYRRLVKFYHPDNGGGGGNVMSYNLVCEAYEYLMAQPRRQPQTRKIFGSTQGSNYYTSRREREVFERNYLKQKEEEEKKKQKVMARERKQKEEYEKAMEAIQAIRVAEALKFMIRDNM